MPTSAPSPCSLSHNGGSRLLLMAMVVCQWINSGPDQGWRWRWSGAEVTVDAEWIWRWLWNGCKKNGQNSSPVLNEINIYPPALMPSWCKIRWDRILEKQNRRTRLSRSRTALSIAYNCFNSQPNSIKRSTSCSFNSSTLASSSSHGDHEPPTKPCDNSSRSEEKSQMQKLSEKMNNEVGN